MIFGIISYFTLQLPFSFYVLDIVEENSIISKNEIQ